ncbi:histidinol-phosphate transaminase [Actinomycetota bacterium]
MSEQVRIRPNVAGLPPYRPGRPPVPREGVAAYKIASNENPHPPLPRVAKAIEAAALEINRYPDAGNVELAEALARMIQVPTEDLAFGPGSVGILGQILQAFCDPGDEVVYPWPSFEGYPLCAGLADATSVAVPLAAGARLDLPAMAAVVTERTRVVLVCTPNNPTGPAVGAGELEALLVSVPRRVLVVVDEAYLEFVTAQDAPDALDVYRRHPNVVVLRTFSKAYGLAGLRIGYAVAQAPLAEAIRKTCLPFAVNRIAQVAAVESIAAVDELQVRVDGIVEERGRVVAALRAQGWDVPDSQANFVWLPLGEESLEFAVLCDSEALSVRPFAGAGVRCSIGETEANDRLVELAAAYRSGRRA